MTGINLTNFKQPLNYEHFLNIPKVVVVLVHYKIATIKVTRIPVILSLIIGQVILIGVVDKARRWRSHHVGLTDWHKEVALASGAGRARLIWMRLDRR
jgi:hypothetical protein